MLELNEVSVETVQCGGSGCLTSLEVTAGLECVTTDADE